MNFYKSSEHKNKFIYDAIGAKCPVTIMKSVVYHLQTLLKSEVTESIVITILGNLGTHSLCKYRTNSNHHFSIASAVETAKLNERDLLRTEMKQIATLKVSPTGVFSACLMGFDEGY